MSQMRGFNVAACAAVVLSLTLAAGCSTAERHPDIPLTAVLASEGSGRLAYRAPEPGIVYVYDLTNEQLIYSGRVEEDEMVVVNPEENHVALDERHVAERALTPGNTHRLFFTPTYRVEDQRVEEYRIEEETRVRER
ncbi:MAG: hypothetical protein WD009_10420 [Phycisphaeraceae bacterium]